MPPLEEEPAEKTEEGGQRYKEKHKRLLTQQPGEPASRRRWSSAPASVGRSRKFFPSSFSCRGGRKSEPVLFPGRTLHSDTPKPPDSLPLGPQFYTKPASALLAPSVPPKACMEVGGRNSGIGGLLLRAEEQEECWTHSPGLLPLRRLYTKSGEAVPCDGRGGRDHLGRLNGERMQEPLASNGAK